MAPRWEARPLATIWHCRRFGKLVAITAIYSSIVMRQLPTLGGPADFDRLNPPPVADIEIPDQMTMKSLAVSVRPELSVANSICAPAPLPSAS